MRGILYREFQPVISEKCSNPKRALKKMRQPNTHYCSLITIHIITLFQVFLSQNSGVPNQKLRRSKSIPRPFQGHSRFCSKFVPSWFFCLFFFAQAFSKGLIDLLQERRKLHQNYTEFDLE